MTRDHAWALTDAILEKLGDLRISVYMAVVRDPSSTREMRHEATRHIHDALAKCEPGHRRTISLDMVYRREGLEALYNITLILWGYRNDPYVSYQVVPSHNRRARRCAKAFLGIPGYQQAIKGEKHD